jgi:hypothetical protein
MNASALGPWAVFVSTAMSVLLLATASSYSGPSEQVGGCAGWALGVFFGHALRKDASSAQTKAAVVAFAVAVLGCILVDEGFVLLGKALGSQPSSSFNSCFGGSVCCIIIPLLTKRLNRGLHWLGAGVQFWSWACVHGLWGPPPPRARRKC